MKRVIFLLSLFINISCIAQSKQTVIESIYADTTYLRDPFINNSIDTFYLSRIQKIEQLINEKGFNILPKDIVAGKIIEVNTNYDTGPGTTDYSKIVTWIYNKEDVFNPLIDIEKGHSLSLNEIKQLKEIIERPLNFNWSECGTYIPKHLILLTNKDGVISFAMSVGCGQIDIYPNDLRIKFGGLEENARKELYSLIAKMKK